VVDKPSGMSSHAVVSRVRRILGTRRVGHAGTLDPAATGVLVLGVGPATRLLHYLVGADKEYLATMRLGVTTTTDDAEGDPVDRGDASGLQPEEILAAVDRLTGDIDQVPSAVSAIKVDGRRAYQRVRAGEDVDLRPRRVHVSSFTVVGMSRVDPGQLDLDVHVACSSGTYVRALARDLGRSLGVGGHLTALRRTRVGPFTLDDAVGLDDPPASLAAAVLHPSEAAGRFLPTRTLGAQEAAAVRRGVAPAATGSPGPVALLDPSHGLLAVAEDSGPRAALRAVFVG